MAHNEDNPCLTYQIRIDDPERRHLEMLAATIAAGLDLETNNILDPGSQVERGAALAVRAARAIQEEVRKDG